MHKVAYNQAQETALRSNRTRKDSFPKTSIETIGSVIIIINYILESVASALLSYLKSLSIFLRVERKPFFQIDFVCFLLHRVSLGSNRLRPKIAFFVIGKKWCLDEWPMRKFAKESLIHPCSLIESHLKGTQPKAPREPNLLPQDFKP